MKIGIPIGGYHRGTTGEYVQGALQRLGHSAVILNRDEFFDSVNGTTYDLFFCVDSGETLDFSLLPQKLPVPVCMWFIDFRHNKHRAERAPADWPNAEALLSREGMIFQAQLRDCIDLKSSGAKNVHWIPMAADPYIWSDEPQVEKKYDIGFIGNVWDKSRAQFLEWLLQSGLNVGFPGHGALWKEEAAALLRSCRVGFNISSFFGDPFAYDINMRFFETLSCGIPLITNYVDTLHQIIASPCIFVKQYRTPQEFTSMIPTWLQDNQFLQSGGAARKFILDAHTYEHRMERCLELLLR